MPEIQLNMKWKYFLSSWFLKKNIIAYNKRIAEHRLQEISLFWLCKYYVAAHEFPEQPWYMMQGKQTSKESGLGSIFPAKKIISPEDMTQECVL